MSGKSIILMVVYTFLSATALILLRLALPHISVVFKERNWLSRDFLFLCVGLGLYGVTLLMWLYIVASNPLSIAYPVAVGLITIFTAVGSFVVTRDGYTPWHAVGAALVISGVTVLAFAGSNGT